MRRKTQAAKRKTFLQFGEVHSEASDDSETRRRRKEEADKFSEVSDDGFVVIEEKPTRLTRQIEEGIFNIHREDYDDDGNVDNVRMTVVRGLIMGEAYGQNSQIMEESEDSEEEQKKPELLVGSKKE